MTTWIFCSQQDAHCITVFVMDPATGRLEVVQEYALEGGPAPMALDPLRRWVVIGLRERPGLATVALDRTRGLGNLLSLIDLAMDPCYVSCDRAGQFVLTAYYAAGACMVHAIDAQGRLAITPHQHIPTAPHAHCIQTDPTNHYAYLPHTVPANQILQYRFEVGTLIPLQPSKAPVEEGVGPRHYDYHPVLPRVYVSNEQGSSVSTYALDGQTGQLTLLQTLSTLPRGWEGRNTCAQIHLAPQGKWLYVSNRGHDSLAIFRVDEETGLLEAVGQQPTEPIPRVFGIEPSGNYLYAAGQGSDRLAAYAIDDQTGRLEPIGSYPLGRNPMWVLGVALDD